MITTRPIAATPRLRRRHLEASRRPEARAGMLSQRDAARACRVGPGMIRLWVETGAWPLPCACRRSTSFFSSSAVVAWIATGTWPADARFR